MSATAFAPEVVAAVCAHMNDDHPDDCLLIVRGLGGVPEATSARMSSIDQLAAHFEASTPGGVSSSSVAFPAPVTERAQLRVEIVRMYHDACAALGIEPRPAEEH